MEKLPKKTAAVEKAQADVKTRNKDGDKQSIKKRATMVNKSEMKITKKNWKNFLKKNQTKVKSSKIQKNHQKSVLGVKKSKILIFL